MQDHPIEYAQKIIELLAETPLDNAKIAIRIARELLDYRANAECAASWAEGVAVGIPNLRDAASSC